MQKPNEDWFAKFFKKSPDMLLLMILIGAMIVGGFIIGIEWGVIQLLILVLGQPVVVTGMFWVFYIGIPVLIVGIVAYHLIKKHYKS